MNYEIEQPTPKSLPHIQRPSAYKLLQFALGRYRRTAIRHRLAHATVILLSSRDPQLVLAAATFRATTEAVQWIQELTYDPPDATIILLDSCGTCTQCISPHRTTGPHPASTAEWIWRASRPIPRSKPTRTQLELLPPPQPHDEKQAPTAGLDPLPD